MCSLPSKIGGGMSLGGAAYSALTGDALTGAAVASLGGLLQTAGGGIDAYRYLTKPDAEAEAEKKRLANVPGPPTLFDEEMVKAAKAARRRLATGYGSLFTSGLDGSKPLGI